EPDRTGDGLQLQARSARQPARRPVLPVARRALPVYKRRGGERRRIMPKHDIVFLIDVDNTLIDNDRVAEDHKSHLIAEVGRERQKRYWILFEELRKELGYADYLGALQRYRMENPRDPNLLTVSLYLVDYPFANRLYPNSLDVIDHLKRWGPV